MGFDCFEMTIQRKRAKNHFRKLLLKGEACFKNEGYVLKQNKTCPYSLLVLILSRHPGSACQLAGGSGTSKSAYLIHSLPTLCL